MKIIEPSFEILQFPSDLRLLEIAGRNCYKSDKQDTDNFIGKIVKDQHLSVIEHLVATVRIIADRGFLAEITRHRLASFSVESTRYCNYAKNKFNNELTFIIPRCFYNADSFDAKYTIWYKQMQNAENSYLELIHLKTKPEDARSILPMSLKTDIIMTANLRSWLEMFPKRCSDKAHPDMKYLMRQIQQEFRKRCPAIFE